MRRIPLGSGGFDYTPGIAFTTVQKPFTINADMSYVITSGRQAGDEFHCDLAVSFPRFYNFIPIIELNYRWSGTAERRQLFRTAWGVEDSAAPGAPSTMHKEMTIEEKGGHTLFVSPGVQVFLTRDFKIEFGLQVPIVKPGDAWVEKVVLHFGIMRYFF